MKQENFTMNPSHSIGKLKLANEFDLKDVSMTPKAAKIKAFKEQNELKADDDLKKTNITLSKRIAQPHQTTIKVVARIRPPNKVELVFCLLIQ